MAIKRPELPKPSNFAQSLLERATLRERGSMNQFGQDVSALRNLLEQNSQERFGQRFGEQVAGTNFENADAVQRLRQTVMGDALAKGLDPTSFVNMISGQRTSALQEQAREEELFSKELAQKAFANPAEARQLLSTADPRMLTAEGMQLLRGADAEYRTELTQQGVLDATRGIWAAPTLEEARKYLQNFNPNAEGDEGAIAKSAHDAFTARSQREAAMRQARAAEKPTREEEIRPLVTKVEGMYSQFYEPVLQARIAKADQIVRQTMPNATEGEIELAKRQKLHRWENNLDSEELNSAELLFDEGNMRKLRQMFRAEGGTDAEFDEFTRPGRHGVQLREALQSEVDAAETRRKNYRQLGDARMESIDRAPLQGFEFTASGLVPVQFEDDIKSSGTVPEIISRFMQEAADPASGNYGFSAKAFDDDAVQGVLKGYKDFNPSITRRGLEIAWDGKKFDADKLAEFSAIIKKYLPTDAFLDATMAQYQQAKAGGGSLQTVSFMPAAYDRMDADEKAIFDEAFSGPNVTEGSDAQTGQALNNLDKLTEAVEVKQTSTRGMVNDIASDITLLSQADQDEFASITTEYSNLLGARQEAEVGFWKGVWDTVDDATLMPWEDEFSWDAAFSAALPFGKDNSELIGRGQLSANLQAGKRNPEAKQKMIAVQRQFESLESRLEALRKKLQKARLRRAATE
jgi:hypothetical protein